MNFNPSPPRIMHVDLNSCFASIEQQANPHLRNKPVAVAAYNSPRGCIVSPSVEAKKYGIKVGMRVIDAKKIIKNIIIKTPDPEKYRDAHEKFIHVLKKFCPAVKPQSIDEAVLDFSNFKNPDMASIARSIKKNIQSHVGEWIRCSVGVSTNSFLAKVAAGLQKPDGFNIINNSNIWSVYNKLTLIDLPGINIQYEKRLKEAGIYTPIDFYLADEQYLRICVFRSVIGFHWYLKLRGYEPDGIESPKKTYGQQYSLAKKTNDAQELSRLIMKLCEKIGRRLRSDGLQARGIHVAMRYNNGLAWHKAKTFSVPFSTTWDIYQRALNVLNGQPAKYMVALLSVSCFKVAPAESKQIPLFDFQDKNRVVYKTVDRINDRWGEYTVIPARMMNMNNLIIDRIAFGK